MSITTRAKFHCDSDTRHAWSDTAITYHFQAAYDPSVPEDQRFAKATPTGEMKILVDNPNVEFQRGAYYYLDITRVED